MSKKLFKVDVPITVSEEMSLPDVIMTVFMSRMLTEEEEMRITRLMESWYDVGAYGGYGGTGFHYMGKIIFDDEQTIYTSVDLGECPVKTLEVLIIILTNALKEYGVDIERIELE